MFPVLPEKPPVSPSGTPGAGGLAPVPELIAGILSGGDFCSSFAMTGGLCQPDDLTKPLDQQVWLPAWCKLNSSLPYCNTEPANEPIRVIDNLCFDTSWNKVPCIVTSSTVQNCYLDWMTPLPDDFGPCNNFVACYSYDDVPVDCDLGKKYGFGLKKPNGSFYGALHVSAGKCNVWNEELGLLPNGGVYSGKCHVNVTIGDKGGKVSPDIFMFDEYLRVVNYYTGVPVDDDKYIGGYPANIVNPPPPPPPEPEPVKPFDPGPNPFNPTMPEVPPDYACAGIVCECIKTVVNALGAVNNTILEVDKKILGIIEQLEEIIDKMPNWFEKLPLELLPIVLALDKANGTLSDILKAINDISVEVTKEAESNIWDFLGDTIKELGDLVEFLIDKIIYLIVPESTDNIVASFNTLNSNLSSKFVGAEQLKENLMTAVNVDEKPIENVKKTFILFGNPIEVTLFNFDYLNMGLPLIRLLMNALMIISTTIWAYRKISSEMIR